MATQIIIALCEGSHDVSFINRILKTVGFVSNESKKLNEFPSPMDKLMASEFIKTDVEQLNLQELRKGVLPSHTLQKEDNWVFLYSMGGDSKKEDRKNIINNIKANIRQEGEIKGNRGNDDTLFSVLYIFDSDKRGVDSRLTEVINEIKEIFPSLKTNIFPANSTFDTLEKIKIGCYIFTGADNNTGKLEDILMPLLRDGSEQIYDDAVAYLQTHFDDARLFPLKVSNTDGTASELRSIKQGDKLKYDKQKSIVGVIGQLQKSGGSNTVCIGQTDYLNLAKMQTNQKCIEFIAFINKFI